MSIFFKARGTNSFGLFIIRIVLGIYMLSLGIMQASKIQLYIDRVKEAALFSENISFIIGFILPFALILFGALYIMGFFTPFTSFSLAIITLCKIFARGFFISQGIPFNKDIIFLACFLLTIFAGAGILSFDALLDKKKPKTVSVPAKQNIVTAEVITEPLKENPPS